MYQVDLCYTDLVEIIYSGEIIAILDYILVPTSIILIENIRYDSTVMRNK